ncbi:SDR family NAD(P)-dependent oxidoreductase [Fulvivirgaceae bacterium BMA12]|uniref:SDR family NAD(P)-dependent oxidoreductase n=1 Tax=Agaribacillus aureus TaxID=3051825 RepID=A0ABT8L661_9BACT|nr:SDR family NAD(P)-dependent oxidoreductase [Fulvivirgaceae bacterium BMA12]
MTKINTVSILGCGWLGYPLAKELIATGYKVKGTTTNAGKMASLQKAGITPFQLTIDTTQTPEKSAVGNFFQCDLLIISLPPKIRKLGAEHGINQTSRIIATAKNFDGKVIYTSSTSVYPTNSQSHDENSLTTNFPEHEHPLLDIEKLLKNAFGNNLTILRLGGLFGYDRIPVKYFLGKKEIHNSKFPVNYLHRDDAVGSIMTVIEKQAWGNIYNVVCPLHPTREAVFLKNAEVLNISKPVFGETVEGNYKIIEGDKIVRELGFFYQFPDPKNFTYESTVNLFR